MFTGTSASLRLHPSEFKESRNEADAISTVQGRCSNSLSRRRATGCSWACTRGGESTFDKEGGCSSAAVGEAFGGAAVGDTEMGAPDGCWDAVAVCPGIRPWRVSLNSSSQFARCGLCRGARLTA